jgi:ribonuclease VapC
VSFVLDTSAIIAALMDETGSDLVFDRSDGSLVSTANLAEVFGYAARRQISSQLVDTFLSDTGIDVVPLSRSEAVLAGKFIAMTRPAGLSLGDRCCLALAKTRNLPTLTADRPWLAFAEALGVEIELIR